MSKEEVPIFHARSREEWRNWLEKNHEKKSIVLLTKYKKHTNKPTFSHQEAMHEAICFGWIDTTAKRINEDVWGVTFRKRTKNSRWSNNTLGYAKKLIKERKMTPAGLAAYRLGLTKPTIDLILPENHFPKDLQEELNKNKKAQSHFSNLAPSYKKTYIRWIEHAKLPETRKKRINGVVKRMEEGKTKWDGKN